MILVWIYVKFLCLDIWSEDEAFVVFSYKGAKICVAKIKFHTGAINGLRLWPCRTIIIITRTRPVRWSDGCDNLLRCEQILLWWLGDLFTGRYWDRGKLTRWTWQGRIDILCDWPKLIVLSGIFIIAIIATVKFIQWWKKTENQSNFMISVKIFEYEKFDYPRAVVSDCSFTNCFAASDSLINEYFDFKPVFSKNRYYRLIRQENNYGLNNMRNPSDFVESNNVKLKETNASGKKIGSSMPVEWDDSEYTTCKMATTWLNTFNKA